MKENSPIAVVTGPLRGKYDSTSMVDSRHLFIRAAYNTALQDSDTMVIMIGPYLNLSENILKAYYDLCDEIVLTGGTDIDPMLHGQVRDPQTKPSNKPRDMLERQLITWAIDDGKPVIAFCRGMQQVVSTLATLHDIPLADRENLIYQHIPDIPGTINHQPTQKYAEMIRQQNMHQIQFTPGTLMYELYGETINTTSRHHQAVNKNATQHIPGGRIVAQSPDGIAEAFEYVNGNGLIIGVQGHWELIPELYKPLLSAVRQSALERSARRRQVVNFDMRRHP